VVSAEPGFLSPIVPVAGLIEPVAALPLGWASRTSAVGLAKMFLPTGRRRKVAGFFALEVENGV
jgi:hypothetical protein